MQRVCNSIWNSSCRGLTAGLFAILVTSMPPFAHAHRISIPPAAIVLADDGSTTTAKNVKAARLSSAEGSVRVLQGGQVITDPAYANQPLFEGTQVETGNDGRAEIQFEDGSIARLTPNTVLTLKALHAATSDKTLDGALQLDRGLAYFELQPIRSEKNAAGAGTGSGLLVAFGSALLGSTGFSVARINYDNPPGEVAILSGSMHLLQNNNQLSLDLHGGESIALNATDASQYALTESLATDSWDNWNSDRDQALSAANAERTPATSGVSDSSNPAWSDLDANGSWYNVPGTGYVWSPSEAAAGESWDPYGYGYWVSYPGAGYVWVSGYRWGYLPYQCGNWSFYDDFGWGWMPGGCYGMWGFGGGALWSINIHNYPGWYKHPLPPGGGKPHPVGAPRGVHAIGPRLAVPSTGSTFVNGNQTKAGQAVVAIDNRAPDEGRLSARGNAPVTIGGATITPLRPIAPRPVYSRGTAGGSASAGWLSSPATRSETQSGSHAASGAKAPSYHAAPAPRPAGGGGAPHFSAPAAPHASSPHPH